MSTTKPGDAPTGLGAWEVAQERHLAELQGGTDRSMMMRLLETSCLLELSKLSAEEGELGRWAKSVVDVLTQFFPLDGCEILLALPDLPEMRASFGSHPRPDADALWEQFSTDTDSRVLSIEDRAHAARIDIEGERRGMLAVWPSGDTLEIVSFLSSAADQIATTLVSIAERERLRRQSAADTALRIASSIDERSGEEQFEELIAAVAALPSATGASLRLSSPSYEPGFVCVAGLLDGPTMSTCSEGFERDGSLRMSITWADAPTPDDTARLEDIVTVLVASLNRAERNRQLLEEAETDPLTGLANRRRVARVLAGAINRAERNGEFVAVAAVDLDGFKQVNDDLGHDVGDLVLQMVADVLRAEARSYDMPARLGGDEFLAVLPSTDAIGARAFGARVVANVERTCASHLPTRVRVTASVGLAVFPGDAANSEALMRAADEALYAAKAAGRNCVKLYDSRR